MFLSPTKISKHFHAKEVEVNNVIVKLPTVIFTDCENLLISNFMDPVSLFI